MAKLQFTKMHGAGNDFVMIDSRHKSIPKLREKARSICDRRTGIGCDQIIVIVNSRKADYKMRIFNADGSEVEMCGNGIRCFAKYLWNRNDKIIRKKKCLDVETLSGIVRAKIVSAEKIQVDMGSPILGSSQEFSTLGDGAVATSLKVGNKSYQITAVSMGNPHCVIFTSDVDSIELEKVGPLIENHKVFPNRTNVEFVQPVSRSRIKVRVWERGSGITLACGTGACASAVVAYLQKKTERKITVDLPGGSLDINWTKEGRVLMTGPAAEVFSGEIKL